MKHQGRCCSTIARNSRNRRLSKEKKEVEYLRKLLKCKETQDNEETNIIIDNKENVMQTNTNIKHNISKRITDNNSEHNNNNTKTNNTIIPTLPKISYINNSEHYSNYPTTHSNKLHSTHTHINQQPLTLDIPTTPHRFLHKPTQLTAYDTISPRKKPTNKPFHHFDITLSSFTTNPHHQFSSRNSPSSSVYLSALHKKHFTRISESLYKVKQTLTDHTHKLAKASLCDSSNTTNEQILTTLSKTKHSAYSREIIEKIKLINSFINTVNEAKFRSDIVRHRKVFVILDGTVVFNTSLLNGHFIDMPTRRYMTFCKNKKERYEMMMLFLKRCESAFKTRIQLRNVYLLNGIHVNDLIDVPDSDKCIYVSHSNIFRGIYIANTSIKHCNDMNTIESDRDNDNDNDDVLNITETAKVFKEHKMPVDERKPSFFVSIKKHRKDPKLLLRLHSFAKKPSVTLKRQFKTRTIHKKYFNDNSFTFGVSDKTEIEQYIYYSDNESNNKCSHNKKRFNLIEHIINKEQNDLENKIHQTHEQSKQVITRNNNRRPNENTYHGLNALITKYNKQRGKHHKLKPTQHHPTTQQTELSHNITQLGNALISNLKLFKHSSVQIDEDKFNTATSLNDQSTNKFIHASNMVSIAEKEIHKYYPDLISLNIPNVLRDFPKLKRRTFYEIFVQFKLLLNICVCINKNLKMIKRGLDFESFFNCLPQVRSQGALLARKIYNTIKTLNTECLNWEDYLNGMLTMKSKNISDKIDTFFKVIDTDGNGLLSYDEVFELSKTSLERTIGEGRKERGNDDDEEDVVMILAEYFANLIFQLVDKPVDEEIPLELIREKIIEGKSAAGYLEMFICADGFT